MTDDKNAGASMVIESAMAELKALGAEHNAAATLLAIQGLCQIGDDDLAALKTVKGFVDEMLEAYASGELQEHAH